MEIWSWVLLGGLALGKVSTLYGLIYIKLANLSQELQLNRVNYNLKQ
jgi:hypothetical protein